MGKTRHLRSQKPRLWKDTSSMYKPGLNDMTCSGKRHDARKTTWQKEQVMPLPHLQNVRNPYETPGK